MNINLPEVAKAGEQYIMFKYVELFTLSVLVIVLVIGGLGIGYLGMNFLMKLIKEG